MKEKLLAGAVIAAAAAGTIAVADAGNPAEQLKMQQMVYQEEKGASLPYCQAVEGKNQPGKYSLILFLHGAGERGTDNQAQLKHGVTQMLDYIRKHGEKVVVIVPQCPAGKQWVDTPWSATSHTIPEQPSVPMAMVMKLLDAKIKEFNVDEKRLYVTGISMGGYGTWDLISRQPDRFAAAIPVCGGADLACAERLKNLPLNVFHGDSDTTVPTIRSRNMVKALKDAGSRNVTYHEFYNCGHNSWTPAYNDSRTWEWLFEQRKKTPFLFFW